MASETRMGRPLLFKSADELLTKASTYFTDTPQEEWTITGVAVYLDTSRETLMNYEHKDDFFDAIKKIKDRVEMAYEISLRRRGGSGDIFGLKNFGWKDRTETDITSNGETVGVTDPLLAAKFNDFMSAETKD